jgi:hypothetical protein
MERTDWKTRAWTRWTPGSSWSRPSPPITPPAISTTNTPWLPAGATRQEDTHAIHKSIQPRPPVHRAALLPGASRTLLDDHSGHGPGPGGEPSDR